MQYIDLEVRTAVIVHGFDDQNREITEQVDAPDFMRKLVAIDRILSISERYLLVSSSHDRVMYWEYKGSLDDILQRLDRAGLMLT
ncbi:hypothetical protein [Halomonas sp. M4R1S46]|uniref:hypothetical protein n=1 Tax=Halomonas sp. M4R1S46 TaxID=2982692 RepID=UPI0021E387D0|nr:hypothetical protein [Halomonas sp. M4R1S46]UYG09174.1 hypothetical protein OCT48_07550 [Halomonas sp. M4R1S46]